MLGACSKQHLLSDANLKALFHFMDASGNGFITRKELQSFFGVNDEDFIGLIIEEADDDCDGGLNQKEFINLMLRISRLG